nr:hypothetical protein [Tanacetum cinerariifolium]
MFTTLKQRDKYEPKRMCLRILCIAAVVYPVWNERNLSALVVEETCSSSVADVVIYGNMDGEACEMAREETCKRMEVMVLAEVVICTRKDVVGMVTEAVVAISTH